METAWSATWTSPLGPGDRTIGFNAEMDALPGIGHACGHNLIAIAGVSAAIGTAKALSVTNIPGKVVLLGTPAEEGGGGKCIMLEAKAYSSMDACLMVHPAPFNGIGSSLAIKRLTVTFEGKTAHAAGEWLLFITLSPQSSFTATPWAGKNALDAAVTAYNSISMLRQQTEDGIRIQGIILPDDSWAQNIIPDKAKMSYGVRGPTRMKVDHYLQKLCACFKGAATSAGCQVSIEIHQHGYDEILMNSPLASLYASHMTQEEGIEFETGFSM